MFRLICQTLPDIFDCCSHCRFYTGNATPVLICLSRRYRIWCFLPSWTDLVKITLTYCTFLFWRQTKKETKYNTTNNLSVISSCSIFHWLFTDYHSKRRHTSAMMSAHASLKTYVLLCHCVSSFKVNVFSFEFITHLTWKWQRAR